MDEAPGAGPRIHHVAIQVTDLERAEAFYRTVFGLPVLDRRHDGTGQLRAVWLSAGGAVVMLERELITGRREGSGHVVVFASDDVAGFSRRAEALGHPIVARTGNTVYLADPDGHTLGVSDYGFGAARSGTASPASTDSRST